MPVPRIAGAALVAIGLAIGVTACSGGTEQPGGTSAPADASSSASPVVAAPPPAPAVSPEDLDASTYESLSARGFALIAKDPNANKGRKVIVSGVVTQFDASTGGSDFRANTGAIPQEVRVNPVNTIVNAPDPTILANVVKGDQVTMWCQVQGTYTYDDVMGGKMTVPVFSVYIIKDNGS
jgi:hypothetical protein